MSVEGRLYRWVDHDWEYDEQSIIAVMDEDEMEDIMALEVGETYMDDFGDCWERLR